MTTQDRLVIFGLFALVLSHVVDWTPAARAWGLASAVFFVMALWDLGSRRRKSDR